MEWRGLSALERGENVIDKARLPALMSYIGNLRVSLSSAQTVAGLSTALRRQPPKTELTQGAPLKSTRDQILEKRSDKLRVAHINEAPMGGVATHLAEVLSYQAASSEIGAVYALVPEGDVGALRQNVRSGATIYPYRRQRRSVTSLFRLALTAQQFLRDTEPDLVHIHSTIAGTVVRLLLLFSARPPKIVYCPHGWAFNRDVPRFSKIFSIAVERILALGTQTIICVSDAEKQSAIAAGIPADKCVVVRNGISDASVGSMEAIAARTERTGPLRVLFIGRFDYQKGFDLYMEIMRRLEDVAEGLAVGGFIVNKPSNFDPPQNIKILGWMDRDDIQPLYEDADLLLMPSRCEGLPFTATEAMRAGLPVFASNVGGNPEAVIDGVTGHLFQIDDLDSVIRVIRSMTRATLAEYGAGGRARFLESFTSATMNRGLLTAYDRVMRRPIADPSIEIVSSAPVQTLSRG